MIKRGVIVDSNTFEHLLNESESEYLDFKQEQYRFDNATEEEKAELLKDVLAFANAWRRTDAYILIGVREVKGGRSIVVGIEKHLEDASLQQFINGKVQKPITFSYIPFEFEEKQVGILHVPVQERPFYVRKKYGKVQPKTVILRRGSSTSEAEPEEIVRMGAELSKKSTAETPNIDCEFCNVKSRRLFGKELGITSTFIDMELPIPSFTSTENPLGIPSFGQSVNRNYYRELFHFYDFRALLKGVGLRFKNNSSVTAYNARVEASITASDLVIIAENEFPDRPGKYHNILSEINTRTSFPEKNQISSGLSIQKKGAGYSLEVNCGNIQPKAEYWVNEPVLIGSRINQSINFDVIVYADNIPNPIYVPLSINFKVIKEKRTIYELDSDQQKVFRKLTKDLYPDEEK